MSYALGARPQLEAARLGLDMLTRACQSVPLGQGPVRLADLGCGPGVNSVEPVMRAVAALRERGSESPIEILHVDLPSNDFAAVLENAKGYDAPNVFRAALAGSFYQPLFPEGHLSLVWTSTATHWLSCIPGERPSPRSTSQAAAARRVWAEQARLDWERWLACRAVELAPGGQVVMVGSGADRFGRILAEPLLEMVYSLAPELSLPTYHRRLEEWLAPLGPTFRLLESEEPTMADPFWDALQATGDVEAYADQVVAFVEGSFEQAGLPLSFAFRLRELVLEAPERARCRWWVNVLRLERV